MSFESRMRITSIMSNVWRGRAWGKRNVVISYQQIVEAHLKIQSLTSESISRL